MASVQVEFITSFGHDSDSDGEAPGPVAGPVGPANVPPEERPQESPARYVGVRGTGRDRGAVGRYLVRVVAIGRRDFLCL